MEVDKCVICGEIVPEGRQVCPACENNFTTKRKTIEASVTLQNGKTILVVADNHRELCDKIEKLNWKKIKQM